MPACTPSLPQPLVLVLLPEADPDYSIGQTEIKQPFQCTDPQFPSIIDQPPEVLYLDVLVRVQVSPLLHYLPPQLPHVQP